MKDFSTQINGADERPIQYPIAYTRSLVHQPDLTWLARNRVIHPGMTAKVVYAYKLLRTQVLDKLKQNGWNCIGILSTRSGQGSSLTAINLGISVAMDPRFTALIVDLNLRNPSLHRYFGVQPESGVVDVIQGKVALEDALFNPGIQSLLVLPGSGNSDNASEQLSLPAFANLVRDIRSRYAQRIIILDLPPLLEAEDAVAIKEFYDAGLVIIADGKTTETDLAEMAGLIGDKPMLGTVFNNVA